VLDAILIFLMGLALIGLTGITFSFLVSSFREKEDRATLFGGIQFVFFFGSLVLFTLSYANGFLETAPGRMLLIVLSAFTAAGTWLLFNRNGENAKALAGTAGLIVGEVERFDERKPSSPGTTFKAVRMHTRKCMASIPNGKKGTRGGVPWVVWWVKWEPSTSQRAMRIFRPPSPPC
jgi:hypothetical protein